MKMNIETKEAIGIAVASFVIGLMVAMVFFAGSQKEAYEQGKRDCNKEIVR